MPPQEDGGDVGRTPSFMRATSAATQRRSSTRRIRLHTMGSTLSMASVTSLASAEDPGPERPRGPRRTGTKKLTTKSEDTGPRYKASQTRLRIDLSSQECLKAVKLFEDCSPAFLEVLAECVNTQIFEAGQEIMRQGEIGTTMYILKRGQVEVLVNGNVVACLGDGSVFGEMAVLASNTQATKRSATIKARLFCDCRVIHREELVQILRLFRRDQAIFENISQQRMQELKDKGLIPDNSAKGRLKEFKKQQQEMRRSSTKESWPGTPNGSKWNVCRRMSVRDLACAIQAEDLLEGEKGEEGDEGRSPRTPAPAPATLAGNRTRTSASAPRPGASPS